MDQDKIFVIASNNKGKVAEFKNLLNPAQIIPQSEIRDIEVEETATTFVENALLKAKGISKFTDHMVIADDSGLVVPELNYEPGLRSARYASKRATDSANKKKLKEKIIEYGVDSLPAYFVCLLVIIKSTNDPMPLIFEGRAYGSVKIQSKGDNGFGYDEINARNCLIRICDHKKCFVFLTENLYLSTTFQNQHSFNFNHSDVIVTSEGVVINQSPLLN